MVDVCKSKLIGQLFEHCDPNSLPSGSSLPPNNLPIPSGRAPHGYLLEELPSVLLAKTRMGIQGIRKSVQDWRNERSAEEKKIVASSKPDPDSQPKWYSWNNMKSAFSGLIEQPEVALLARRDEK